MKKMITATLVLVMSVVAGCGAKPTAPNTGTPTGDGIKTEERQANATVPVDSGKPGQVISKDEALSIALKDIQLSPSEKVGATSFIEQYNSAGTVIAAWKVEIANTQTKLSRYVIVDARQGVVREVTSPRSGQ